MTLLSMILRENHVFPPALRCDDQFGNLSATHLRLHHRLPRRVQALGRGAHGTKTPEISIGGLVIDLASRTVPCGGSW